MLFESSSRALLNDLRSTLPLEANHVLAPAHLVDRPHRAALEAIQLRVLGVHWARGEPQPRLVDGIRVARVDALHDVQAADDLADRVYGWTESVESNALAVHIHSLRRKFGEGLIETVRGEGYRLGTPP